MWSIIFFAIILVLFGNLKYTASGQGPADVSEMDSDIVRNLNTMKNILWNQVPLEAQVPVQGVINEMKTALERCKTRLPYTTESAWQYKQCCGEELKADWTKFNELLVGKAGSNSGASRLKMLQWF